MIRFREVNGYISARGMWSLLACSEQARSRAKPGQDEGTCSFPLGKWERTSWCCWMLAPGRTHSLCSAASSTPWLWPVAGGYLFGVVSLCTCPPRRAPDKAATTAFVCGILWANHIIKACKAAGLANHVPPTIHDEWLKRWVGFGHPASRQHECKIRRYSANYCNLLCFMCVC